ncbi:hypothetical protein AB4Y90_17550, partial [Chryseobacterium sp. 2TAF14]|uniref:hypothetical protein n=1 Tax=Chryseobacterium sp. 2TAF14 TaxID=3233007 RepID=UPI003F8F6D2D
MNIDKVLFNVSEHVQSIFKSYPNKSYLYHDFQHAILMVEKSRELAVNEKLNEYGRFVLETALWFYNTTYLFCGNHIKVAMLAADFLKSQGVNYKYIQMVALLIMAVEDKVTFGFLELIMYDATFFDLADHILVDRMDQLRLEREAIGQLFETEEMWQKELIALIEQHRFYSSYAVSA